MSKCFCTGGCQEKDFNLPIKFVFLKYYSRRIMFSKTTVGNGMTVSTFEN